MHVVIICFQGCAFYLFLGNNSLAMLQEYMSDDEEDDELYVEDDRSDNLEEIPDLESTQGMDTFNN